MSSSPKNRPDVSAQFRAIMDLAMGVLYILVALYSNFNIGLQERLGKSTMLGLVILFCVYGLYRIIKGAYTVSQLMKRRK